MKNQKDEVQKLMQMKEEIEKAKTEKAQAEGKLESYLDQLEKEFRCKNEEQAEDLLESLEKELEELQAEFDKGMEKLNKD